jgi:hypothetical protein
MKTIELIEKEQISTLSFPKEDAISNPEERVMRMADLYRSQTLGNLLRTKVKLTFEASDDRIFQVYTTVWAVGSHFVSLKGGVHIPIRSILKVD